MDIKILLMLGIIGILIIKLEPQHIAASFCLVDRSFLFGAMLLLVPNLVIQAAKWQYLVRRVAINVRPKEILSSLFLGFSLGLVSPGRIGELARGLCIPGESKTRIAGLVVVDKIYNMLIIVLISITAMIALYPLMALPGIMVIALMIWGSFHVKFIGKRIVHLCARLSIKGRIDLLLEGINGLTPQDVTVMLLWSLAFTVALFAQFYLLLLAFVKVSFRIAFICISWSFLIKILLPITWVDLGVREAAAVALFWRFGIARAPVFNAAFLLFVINVLTPALIGVASVVTIHSPRGTHA